tara:strand:+ start:138 stop:362 length:225 start_codon:yes stop_codon:yes gene_type:complete
MSADQRDRYFQNQLTIISKFLNSQEIPVFIECRGEKFRLDKGYISHAIANAFLKKPINTPNGFIEKVVINDDFS